MCLPSIVTQLPNEFMSPCVFSRLNAESKRCEKDRVKKCFRDFCCLIMNVHRNLSRFHTTFPLVWMKLNKEWLISEKTLVSICKLRLDKVFTVIIFVLQTSLAVAFSKFSSSCLAYIHTHRFLHKDLPCIWKGCNREEGSSR